MEQQQQQKQNGDQHGDQRQHHHHHHAHNDDDDRLDKRSKMRGEYARRAVYTNADGTETNVPEYRREWARGQMKKINNENGETRYKIQNLKPLNFVRVGVLFLINWVGLFIAGGVFVALEGPNESDVRALAFQELDDARADVAALILSSTSSVVAESLSSATNATTAAAAYANLNATHLAGQSVRRSIGRQLTHSLAHSLAHSLVLITPLV